MAKVQQFGLVGINSNVQLGVQGGHISYSATADASGAALRFLLKDNTTLGRIQAADPALVHDLTTKNYVDTAVSALDTKYSSALEGLNTKEACRLMSNVTNTPLTGSLPLSIDNKTVKNLDRIVLNSQLDPTQNGIYVANVGSTSYTLTRSADANNVGNPTSLEGGDYFFITDGDLYAATGWVLASPVGVATIGTSVISFNQFSSQSVLQPGTALTQQGQLFNVNTDGTTIYTDITNNLAIAAGSSGQILVSGSNPSASWGSLNLANSASVGTSVLGTVNGGTGLSAVGTTGQFLTSTGTAMSWQSLNLATMGGTSILPSANGGTGQSTYANGDMLYGSTNALSKLTVGTSGQILTSDGSKPKWTTLYYNSLNDTTTGTTILAGTNAGTANNLTVTSSATGVGVGIGSAGTDANVNIVVSPKGTGLLMGGSGYTLLPSSPATAFTPKSYVDTQLSAFTLARLQNSTNDTFFDTNLTGFSNTAVVGSNNKVVAEFVGSTTNAILGEKLLVSHTNSEVQLSSVNTAGTGNVNFRLIPQGSGQLFIGTAGNGQILSEAGYNLNVAAGAGTAAANGGTLYLQGGSSTTGNKNGGNIILQPGTFTGTGTSGNTQILDDQGNNIVLFGKGAAVANNYLQIENSAGNVDPTVSAVKIQTLGATSDISLQFVLNGNGMLRVANPTNYVTLLSGTGNNDCLVTKGYVSSFMASTGTITTAGTGLTKDSSGVMSVNVGGETINVDGSNNLVVTSSPITGQVLLSSGTPGTEATWGGINLNNAAAVTGALLVANGGTGLSTYTAGSILYGNASNAISELPIGSNGQVLGVASGALTYNYVSKLLDTNGNIVVATNAATTPVNNLVISNAATGTAVNIGVTGTDSNISLMLSPQGSTGLILAPSGYSTLIQTAGTTETIATIGYVNSKAASTATTGVVRAVFTASTLSTVNIGSVLPTIAGKGIYISRIIFKIVTPFVGAAHALVNAGSATMMLSSENDLTTAGTYVAYTDMSTDSTGQQIAVLFTGSDDVTAQVPSAGSFAVTIEYDIA